MRESLRRSGILRRIAERSSGLALAEHIDPGGQFFPGLGDRVLKEQDTVWPSRS